MKKGLKWPAALYVQYLEIMFGITQTGQSLEPDYLNGKKSPESFPIYVDTKLLALLVFHILL